MRIDRTGKIMDGFYVVGSPHVPVYLLDGPSPVLFDAGFTAFSSSYEKDIRRILGGRDPAYLLITHAHFDHVGAAGHFKALWPEMKIAGSEQCRDILARPNAIELITTLNEDARKEVHSWGPYELDRTPFEPFRLDFTLKPDEVLGLSSGLSVKALYTPGHTRDFMSYWVPEKGILVASESAGCDDGTGYIATGFLTDYDIYRQSLERLSGVEIEVLCPGHHLVLTGEDARGHMARSLSQASLYVSMVEDFLQEERGDIERAVARVKVVEWDVRPWPKQPEQAYLINTRARVKALWDRMNRST